MSVLARRDYVPLTREELAEKLEVNRRDFRKLDWELEHLLGQGKIVRVKDDRFCLPEVADLVTGKLHFRQTGNALLFIETEPSAAQLPAVEIFSEDTSTAMHGDRVVVRLSDRLRPPRRGESEPTRTGKVIRILERARSTLTGTLQRTKKFFYVSPDDPRFVHDIYVPNPGEAELTPAPQLGDKVVVKLGEWLDRRINPEGEIVEVLGKTFEPRAELAAIYHKYKLDKKFPEDVEKEVAMLPDEVRPQDREHRLDIRELPTFTIDPDDAKDFDDALSIEHLDAGDIRVGVHIADVSAYVKPGTALDREAQRRGNSTYLVGTVVPMLPFKLSNGLCSLKEGEDRVTKSVFFTFNRGGKLKETAYANTVIHSRKRLTYRQAYALLKEDNLEKIRRLPLPPAHQTGSTGRALSTLSDDELRSLQKWIRQLWTIAAKLRGERFRNGALELDMPETKIFVDAEGYADRLEKIQNDESHQLIEEFMLLANEAVARATRQNKLPSIYRVHDEPEEDKLQEYREFAATMGVQAGDLTNRQELSRVLHVVRTHPQNQILRTQLLRSLKRACYRAEPDGHFGLAKRDYTHFTSPIRRYSDLVVHRVYDYFLVRHRGASAPRGWKFEYRAEKMPGIAEHLSITEQNSTEAERESVKVKLLEFFERELKKKKRTAFAATIVELRNHGMFVELVDSQAYGFVPLSTMKDDFYTVAQGGAAIVGRRSKRRYALGDRINVNVDRVDRFKRQMDFRLTA